MGSLTRAHILRFHPLGEEPNLAKIAGKLMNTGRNQVHSFLTRGFGMDADWKLKLAREIKAGGFHIDLNKAL